MAICLCGHSADRVLENLAVRGMEVEPVSGAALQGLSANIDETARLLGGYLDASDGPIEVLVGRPSAMRHGPRVLSRLWSGYLPDGSILRMDEGLYVCSPVLCLLQAATELHMVNFCQMLGRYMGIASSIPDSTGSRPARRPPLVEEEQLIQSLRALGRVRGSRVVREAMSFTLPGAASPQETNMQLLMTLPFAYYGFGFKGARLNYEVKPDGEAKALIAPKSRIYIDLAWPGKAGLEYQGSDHGNTLGEDYARLLAAHALGYELWMVAKEQMTDAVQMDYIARQVARRIKRKVNPKTWPRLGEVQQLLDVLNGRRTPKPGEFERKRARRSEVRLSA